MPSPGRKRPREPANAASDDATPTLEFVVAGCGAGDTAVYTGAASSCFLLRCRNADAATTTPLLVVDAGFGAQRAIAALCGKAFPAQAPIYISHNHSDHAAELPVVAAVEGKRWSPLTVLAEEGVAETLRTHRLAELRSTGQELDDFVDLWELSAGEGDGLGDGPVHQLPLGDVAVAAVSPWQLGLTLVRAAHSERCFGFVLKARRRKQAGPGDDPEGAEDGWVPLLGFSGDSAYRMHVYRALAHAPLVVVDARPLGAGPRTEHAVVEEVAKAALYPGNSLTGARRVVIYGYGGPAERRAAERDLARGRKLAAETEAVHNETFREKWAAWHARPIVEIATSGLVLPVPWPRT